MSKKHQIEYCEDYIDSTRDLLDNLMSQFKSSATLSAVPNDYLLNKRNSCICFGKPKDDQFQNTIVGMPEGYDGHLLIIGGSGSGKSSGILKPTITTWDGALICNDIKGELSDYYLENVNQGIAKRPCIIFNPMDRESPSYDPFSVIRRENQDRLVQLLWPIVFAFFPNPTDDKEKFWRNSVQSVFMAVLIYCYNLNLSFIQTISFILESDALSISQTIMNGEDDLAKCYIGSSSTIREDTVALFDRELRDGLIVFTEPSVRNAFRDESESEQSFSWDIIERSNVFLRIPENQIDQLSGVINLLYSQLFYYLEQRPEKYSASGSQNNQTLIMMDEFARFGKLDPIKNAVSTLRSKSVNICLVVQSIAQLDSIYGQLDRRIIMDNCQHKVIMNSCDPETQQLLTNLIGTRMIPKKSTSSSDSIESIAITTNISTIREPYIQPHELAYLNDIILLTPKGGCRIDKIKLYDNDKNLFVDEEEMCNSVHVINTEVIDCQDCDGIPTITVPATAVRIIHEERI